jgi:hypothetical protein
MVAFMKAIESLPVFISDEASERLLTPGTLVFLASAR